MKAKLELNTELKGMEEAILVAKMVEGFGVDIDSLSLNQLVCIKFAVKRAIQKELDEINETR